MTKLEDFNHPCKETCSGWSQAYEKGFRAGKHSSVSTQILVEAMEFAVRFMTEQGDDKLEECEPEYQMLRSFKTALEKYKSQGDGT